MELTTKEMRQQIVDGLVAGGTSKEAAANLIDKYTLRVERLLINRIKRNLRMAFSDWADELVRGKR